MPHNSKESDYVDEQCSVCGKIMTNVKYIWIDDNDRYLCTTCKNDEWYLCKTLC